MRTAKARGGSRGRDKGPPVTSPGPVNVVCDLAKGDKVVNQPTLRGGDAPGLAGVPRQSQPIHK